MCGASAGELSTVMQMRSDGEGTRMLIESQTVFPRFDFRQEGTVLFLLNPTAVTQPNLSLYQDTLFQVTVRWKNQLPSLTLQGHQQLYQPYLASQVIVKTRAHVVMVVVGQRLV